MLRLRTIPLLLLLVAYSASTSMAQEQPVRKDSVDVLEDIRQRAEERTRWAWKDLFTVDGLHVSYIYYGQVESKRLKSGLVVKVMNTNDYPITYRFTLIMESDGEQAEDFKMGVLKAGEARTGDNDGLYWMPFPPGREIDRLGVRGYKIEPLRGDDR